MSARKIGPPSILIAWAGTRGIDLVKILWIVDVKFMWIEPYDWSEKNFSKRLHHPGIVEWLFS